MKDWLRSRSWSHRDETCACFGWVADPMNLPGKNAVTPPPERATLRNATLIRVAVFLSEPLRVLVGAVEVMAGLVHFKLACLGRLRGFR